jgi:histidyl-tRNA synthetase
MEYSIPKGVFDILPQEPNLEDQWKTSDKWEYVEEVILQTAKEYGYREIRTPIFERTELFIRGVGESSDIVAKEMYTFQDKADRSMTLRPEGTAPAMRAFIEKQLYQLPTLHKLFYIGPMFRYERPQAGRYRQHYQFGAEAIGISNAEQDVEMIDLLYEIYHRLGLKNLTVMLNTVGDEACREPYRQALKEYLKPHFEKLSPDSKMRFSKNILRILDSKDSEDQKILQGAPSILSMLTQESQEHFKQVQNLLEKIRIPYVINTKLVRGLDYYNKTVFEVISGELGAQNTIGGGGRYDGLLATLGGPDLPAVGFATGIERILQTMVKQNAFFPSPSHPFVFIVPLGLEPRQFCFDLLCQLRHEKIAAEIDLSGKKIQHGLQLANHLKAEYCLIIGDQELETGLVKLKNMISRESLDLKLSEIISKIKELRKEHV